MRRLDLPLIPLVLRALRAAIAALTIGVFFVAAVRSGQTRAWRPVTVGDFKRVIHATADRKVVHDQTSTAAANPPAPEPPVLPAAAERIPPAVPRKEDDDDQTGFPIWPPSNPP
jgi:hypothetical protein